MNWSKPLGPTLSEMREPSTIDGTVRGRARQARVEAPLDPVNLYNITWYGSDDEIRHFVVPRELTGVEAPIAVIYSRDFPTGSHKVGAAYS
ncbi:MAG: pyridoxal-5'-phosphate-dependent protein subunit beta, partial [Vicinamibacteria bacterium]